MIRSLMVLLAACSSSAPAKEPLSGSATPHSSVADFVPSDAQSFIAWRPPEFPYLSIADSSPDMFACWRALEERITGAYQIVTSPKHSLAVLEGDLPREQVERCVERAYLYSRIATGELRRDGELSALDTKLGTVYAAWRGHAIVFGNRESVMAALSAVPTAQWREAIASLPPTGMTSPTTFAAVSFDRTFGGLLGVPTTSWRLTMDHAPAPWPARNLISDDGAGDALERFGEEQEALARRKAAGLPPLDAGVPEPKPAPVFSGRIELRYANGGDAATAAAALAKGAFAFPLEENLAAALSHLPRSLTGSTLVVTFDQTSFANLELDKLQAWLAKAQAAAAH